MKLDSLKRKLESQLIKYFKNQDYLSSEIEDLGLYTINIEQNIRDRYSDIYIYAEISVDEFFSLKSSWDVLVKSVDDSAYFDIVSPGIYIARIYWDSARNKEQINNENILNSSNLIKFGNFVISIVDDQLDEDFWLDDISVDFETNKLYIEISSQKYQSSASVPLYPEDIDNYEDLIDLYADDVAKALVDDVIES